MVLVDNAGGHVAKALKVPGNVRLYPLPPCTPELQPAEHLWPLVREALANLDFDHLVGLAAELAAAATGWRTTRTSFKAPSASLGPSTSER